MKVVSLLPPATRVVQYVILLICDVLLWIWFLKWIFWPYLYYCIFLITPLVPSGTDQEGRGWSSSSHSCCRSCRSCERPRGSGRGGEDSFWSCQTSRHSCICRGGWAQSHSLRSGHLLRFILLAFCKRSSICLECKFWWPLTRENIVLFFILPNNSLVFLRTVKRLF